MLIFKKLTFQSKTSLLGVVVTGSAMLVMVAAKNLLVDASNVGGC